MMEARARQCRAKAKQRKTAADQEPAIKTITIVSSGIMIVIIMMAIDGALRLGEHI